MSGEKKCDLGLRAVPVAVKGDRVLAVVHDDRCGVRVTEAAVANEGDPVPEGMEYLERRPDGTFARPAASPGGPAMVNSAGFRSGWERIFGGRQEVGLA